MVQWARIHLPRQGAQVRFLIQEDRVRHRATRPVGRNYRAHSHTAEAHSLAPVLSDRGAPQREALTHHSQREPVRSDEDPAQPRKQI